MSRKTGRFQAGEKILLKTKPRLFANLSSVILKFIVLFLIVYLFRFIITAMATVQTYLISIVRVPLVNTTAILIYLLILILFLWIIWDIIAWRSVNYLITNKRITIEKGVIRKSRTYIHYDKIQDIIISRSLIQRISFCGDIEIFGGHEHTKLLLQDIPDPAKMEDMINRLIEGEDVKFERSSEKPLEKSVIVEHSKKFKR